MKRDEIVSLLRENRHRLKEMGIKSLAMFGSVARDEATEASDVDMLIEFDGPVTFDRFMEAKFFLEDLLGMPVDLVVPQAVRPRLRPYIEQDMVYVT